MYQIVNKALETGMKNNWTQPFYIGEILRKNMDEWFNLIGYSLLLTDWLLAIRLLETIALYEE